MDEAKQTNPPKTDADTGAQTDARHEEATSHETLSDLQETQIDSAASQSATSESSDSSSLPSPDGMPDATGGGGDSDDPM
ncbi:MAG TPA: hypothetical protein VF703_06680 [Pyrinomonadaceae bacterium]|jgi:hypothetical protein